MFTIYCEEDQVNIISRVQCSFYLDGLDINKTLFELVISAFKGAKQDVENMDISGETEKLFSGFLQQRELLKTPSKIVFLRD